MGGERRAQGIAGRRDDADAAPVGVDHFHSGVELTARCRITAGPHHFRIAIVQKAASLDELAQHGIERSHQALGGESSDRRGYSVFFWYESPFLGTHHCRYMTGADERIETRRS